MTVTARSAVKAWSTMNGTPCVTQSLRTSWEQSALSVRTMTSRWCGSTRSGAKAASSTVMGSAAVPDPAFPGRRSATRGSRVASKVASSG